MEKMAAVDVGRLFETLPRSREERWDVLKQFFSGWLGALGAADGCSLDSISAAERRLGIALPVSLKEWYELAGLRESVWSCQDHFLIPEKLRVEGDRLIICVENQSVVKWGIRVDEMHEDDPPVYVSDQEDEENWIRETPSVSMFALAQMLLAVKFSESTIWSANGQATDSALVVIAQNYTRLDFPDLHWPPYPTRFYGGRDLLIETDAETWIWMSGRGADSFRSGAELMVKSGVQLQMTR